jgi:speckle-type POZ protein
MAGVFNWIRLGYELVSVKLQWNVQVPFLHTADGNGETLESSLFCQQETPNSKWKLLVYDKTTEILIEMWHYNTVGERVFIVEAALVKMSILNPKGWKVLQQMLPTRPTFVQFKLCKRDLIKLKCQQVDGSLTFCCKIFTHVKREPTSSSADDPESFAIDCTSGLSNHFEELFNNMPLSDVHFRIGEREFPAHKVILGARSNVFEAMFKHSSKEQSTNQVNIEDIKPEVFQELLRFVYTGRVPLDKLETMAVGLFIAADKYLLDELKLKCQNYLLHHMTPENCLVLLLHGNLLNPTGPLKEAAKFFRRLPSQVMATDGWKKTRQENPTLLFDIYEFVHSHK